MSEPCVETRMSPVVQVGILGLGAAVALGFSRFAYALVLPDMRSDLGWSYSEAGWMNGINAAGYLGGVLIAVPIASRIGHRPAFALGVIITAISVLATGLTRSFELLTLFRLLAGIAAAFAFVIGGAMSAQVSSRAGSRSAVALGLFYAGPGFGMVVAGLFVPAYSAHYGPSEWQGAWILVGICALAAAMISLAGMPASTRDSGSDRGSFRTLSALPVLFGYAAFGGGYIGYMTFIFALLKQLGADQLELSLFWILTGMAGMASPWLWAWLIGGQPHGRALSALIGITCLGTGIPLVFQSMIAAYISGIIFGAAFLSVVAATTAFVRRNADPRDWTAGIAVFTIFFGFGQTFGPLLVGWMSDATGSLSTGLWYGCLFLAAGMILAAFQSDFGVKSN